jgi:hypothetical protein
MSRTRLGPYRAEVCGLTVGSRYRFIVCGNVRGLVSQHSTISGAVRSRLKDKMGCKAQGGHSDAAIYEWSDLRSAWVMYVWPG